MNPSENAPSLNPKTPQIPTPKGSNPDTNMMNPYENEAPYLNPKNPQIPNSPKKKLCLEPAPPPLRRNAALRSPGGRPAAWVQGFFFFGGGLRLRALRLLSFWALGIIGPEFRV